MKIPSLIMGIGALLAGGRALQEAFEGDGDGERLREAPTGGDRMRVRTYRVNTVAQRVGYITQMIRKGREHPDVRKKASQLLSRKCRDARTGKPTWCVPEKNWRAEVEAIFGAVRESVRYTRDTYGADLFQHPRRTLQFGAGDCDDIVIVLGAMLQSVGYPIKLRVIRTTGAPDWDHIYLLVGLPPRQPRRWLPLDASVDRPAGWQPPRSMVAAVRDFAVK